MDYLDSAYLSGINPLNIGNLNAQQAMGLGSLSPQTAGRFVPGGQANVSNYALPNPTFSPDAANYFPGGTESFSQPITPDMLSQSNGFQTPTQTPYFDPNYPTESMVALRDYLAPQVKAGADAGMQSRGLGYSGLSGMAEDKAGGYLNSIAPQVSPQEAQYMDFARLYGSDVANSLATGSQHTPVWPNSFPAQNIPASLPGATPYGPNDPSRQWAILNNPNYNPNGGLNGLQSPQFSIYDFGNAGSYETPGYFYNPNSPPDTSKMPWLANAT